MAFDLKDVKQLVDLMRRSDLTEFELEQEGVKVRIKRDSSGAPVASATQVPFAMPMTIATAPAQPVASAPVPVAAAPVASAPATGAVAEAGMVFVKSPMVGTYYRSPSPDTPAFVDKGSTVNPETIVCIIEAMKVMNEIQSEVKGTIVETLVENGSSVEYGQALYKVKVG